jgi:uncharacterized protein (DUF302 family)
VRYLLTCLTDVTTKVPCIIEIHEKIAAGTSRTAYHYTILSADFDDEDSYVASVINKLTCGVIKYPSHAVVFHRNHFGVFDNLHIL